MNAKDLEISAMFLNLCHMYKMCKLRRQRRWRIRPNNMDWEKSGYHRKVFLKMKEMDSDEFFCHTRMNSRLFDMLLKLVYKSLRKNKQKINPEERLSLTLLYLAQGLSLSTIACKYKLGKTTIRNIILETCEVLWSVLSPTYVCQPTESQYKKIAADFKEMLDIPCCVGVIEAKHIRIRYQTAPETSILLMATCDANYTFTSVSIGFDHSLKDAGIFHRTPFGKDLINNTLSLPPCASITGRPYEKMPHYFIGSASFPLRMNLMRPYSGANLNSTQKCFNNKLSKAYRIIENSFGILTDRWQILAGTLESAPENCETFVLACVALHNFIMQNDEDGIYCPSTYVDWEGPDNTIHRGDWRQEKYKYCIPLRSFASFIRRGPNGSMEIRDRLAEYFMNTEDAHSQNSEELS